MRPPYYSVELLGELYNYLHGVSDNRHLSLECLVLGDHCTVSSPEAIRIVEVQLLYSLCTISHMSIGVYRIVHKFFLVMWLINKRYNAKNNTINDK